jgi:hypothetical protein
MSNLLKMEKIKVLIAFIHKQHKVIENLHLSITKVDLNDYNQQYVFALKTQQLYTAVEDLLKSTAVTFENNIDSPQSYHIELLKRMKLDIPDIRPAVISEPSFKILDKLRGFRHFIRHGYDYELDKDELLLLQNKITESFMSVSNDIDSFVIFLEYLLKHEE